MGRAKPESLTQLRRYALLTYPFACVPFLYFYFHAHGTTLTQYGDSIACYYLAMVCAEVPTGVLADRFGRRLALVLGPWLFAVGFVLLWAWPTWPAICVGQAVLGLGHAVMSGPPTAFLYATLDAQGRGHEFLHEESRMQMLRLLGTAGSFAAGGLLAAAAGIGWTLPLTAALGAGAGLVALRLQELRSPPPVRAVLGSAWRDLLAQAMRWILLWYVVVFFVLRFLFHDYQPFLISIGQKDPLLVGLLFGAMNLVAAPFSRCVPAVRSRLGEAGALWLVLAVLCLSTLAMALPVGALALLWLFVHQVPFGMHWPVVQGCVNARSAETSRATLLSAMSFTGRCAFALGFPWILRLQQREGIAAACLLVGAAAIVLGGASLAGARRWLV
jgi:MFS family permease